MLCVWVAELRWHSGIATLRQQLGVVLDSIEVKNPRIPVVSNVDAEPHSDPDVIKDILKKQVGYTTVLQ